MAAISPCTNAVVASDVSLSPAVGVGAVGEPVKFTLPAMVGTVSVPPMPTLPGMFGMLPAGSSAMSLLAGATRVTVWLAPAAKATWASLLDDESTAPRVRLPVAYEQSETSHSLALSVETQA